MNKKIKIIELLNKIANREEIPRHIKYEYYQYDWSDGSRDYICEDADGERLHMFNDGYICILCNNLNDEVEILEDNTEEIEKLDRSLKFDDLIEPYGKNEDMMWTEIIKQHNKIDEIIRYIKRKEKNND